MTQDELEKHRRGWITAEGMFFPCKFHQHNETAKRIIGEGLTKSHFVTLIRLHPDTLYGMLATTEGDVVTKKQRETLFDLCTKNGYVFEDVAILIDDIFE